MLSVFPLATTSFTISSSYYFFEGFGWFIELPALKLFFATFLQHNLQMDDIIANMFLLVSV